MIEIVFSFNPKLDDCLSETFHPRMSGISSKLFFEQLGWKSLRTEECVCSPSPCYASCRTANRSGDDYLNPAMTKQSRHLNYMNYELPAVLMKTTKQVEFFQRTIRDWNKRKINCQLILRILILAPTL